MLINFDNGMANLDTYKSCLQSQLGHSEIDVTHNALFFECNSIMNFLLSKNCFDKVHFLEFNRSSVRLPDQLHTEFIHICFSDV